MSLPDQFISANKKVHGYANPLARFIAEAETRRGQLHCRHADARADGRGFMTANSSPAGQEKDPVGVAGTPTGSSGGETCSIP